MRLAAFWRPEVGRTLSAGWAQVLRSLPFALTNFKWVRRYLCAITTKKRFACQETLGLNRLPVSAFRKRQVQISLRKTAVQAERSTAFSP